MLVFFELKDETRVHIGHLYAHIIMSIFSILLNIPQFIQFIKMSKMVMMW
jgi:hypothetical protein